MPGTSMATPTTTTAKKPPAKTAKPRKPAPKLAAADPHAAQAKPPVADPHAGPPMPAAPDPHAGRSMAPGAPPMDHGAMPGVALPGATGRQQLLSEIVVPKTPPLSGALRSRG